MLALSSGHVRPACRVRHSLLRGAVPGEGQLARPAGQGGQRARPLGGMDEAASVSPHRCLLKALHHPACPAVRCVPDAPVFVSDPSEMVNVASRAGRGSTWCWMEPKCPSTTLSPERVSSGFSVVIQMRVVATLIRFPLCLPKRHCHCYFSVVIFATWYFCGVCRLDCVKVEEEFELCLPDGDVTVHGAVGASELINTAKSGTELRPTDPPTLCLWQGALIV